MLKNVYLFMWEEKYLLDQEINRRTSNFVQKFGRDSLFVYNMENWDEVSASQSIFWWWLFSQKKLTIVYGVPLDNSKWNTFKIAQIEWFIDNFVKKEWKIPQDNLLVFVSNKPDKRSKFFKFLKGNANIKEFKFLSDGELRKYIKSNFVDIEIQDDAVDYLINKVGNELYRVSSEIDKLKMYCKQNDLHVVDANMIEDITFGFTEKDVFKFLKIMLKDKDRAFNYLEKTKNQWINRNAFSGGLYWGLKVYIILYFFAEKWIRDMNQIAQETWLNPFILKQNQKYMDIIFQNWIQLQNMYKKLVETEVDIKSGKKGEEFFWLSVKSVIEKFKL